MNAETELDHILSFLRWDTGNESYDCSKAKEAVCVCEVKEVKGNISSTWGDREKEKTESRYIIVSKREILPLPCFFLPTSSVRVQSITPIQYQFSFWAAYFAYSILAFCPLRLCFTIPKDMHNLQYSTAEKHSYVLDVVCSRPTGPMEWRGLDHKLTYIIYPRQQGPCKNMRTAAFISMLLDVRLFGKNI